MSELATAKGLCVLCPVYRNDLCARDCDKHNDRADCRTARRPETPQACEPCRRRIASELRDVPNLHEVAVHLMREPGRSSDTQPRAPEFESRLPAPVDVLNLVGPATAPQHLTRQGQAAASDQVGLLPPLFVLHQWAQDWRRRRGMGETGPVAKMRPIATWLANRLDWALDTHPAVADFARDVHEMVRHLRGVAGINKLVHVYPVPCPTCGASNKDGGTGLRRESGADHIVCHTCGRMWTEPEYLWLAKTTADDLDAQGTLVVVTDSATHDAGLCPELLPDGGRCGAQLRAFAYAEEIRCPECGAEWHRRRKRASDTRTWLKLRAAQAAVAREETDGSEAA